MSASETQFESVVNAAQIYIACTTSILIWDWLSCLPQERKYIWKSKSWTPIKFLYCMVRYYTFMVLIVTDVWFFAGWSENACARYVRILPGIAVLIDLSVEAVLAIRVYALYACDRHMAAFLITMLVGFLGVMIAVPILAFDYNRLPQWPGPCMVTGKPSIAGPKFIIAFYAAPMTCDFIMTALTVYRLFEQNREGPTNSLMKRMVRDGLFYFVAISVFNLLNVIFFIQGNEMIQAINAPASIQISSVLCCRLILNLRAENDANTAVRRFSNTKNQWVTDIIHDASVLSPNANPIRFSANPNIYSPDIYSQFIVPPAAHLDGETRRHSRMRSHDGSLTMTSGIPLELDEEDDDDGYDVERQSGSAGSSFKLEQDGHVPPELPKERV
ncbi:hypothetical protein MIND_00979300 [Mycena indigotica]|uniref:DUF6533 domain-containing protein n=1 Tax=Mycena indigotica TaxID=2126181 RepID=A0A8H6SDC3_9AGAR|nr:uncharacterized protein MIND_00979300 [Mycena indigotica]KAF7297456.1 hypothetical protein MIND_00979300 [Mycena indigotica]